MQTHNQRVGGLVLALLFAGTAVAVLATAHSYSRASGLLPVFSGWIFVFLASLEVLVQVRSLIANRGIVSEMVKEGKTDNGRQQWLQSFKGFLWLALILALIYIAGFLIGTLVFVFLFLLTSGHKSLSRSVGVAAGATAFIYLVFVKLLEYKLFAGILFQE
jgi:hypothetical protein